VQNQKVRDEMLERGIPPPDINYNQSAATDRAAYVRAFKEGACLREWPFIVTRAGLSPASAVLDYGCGFGRLAYAAYKWLSDDGAYFGYEVNQTALAFLRNSWNGRRGFAFAGAELAGKDDYIAMKVGDGQRGGAAPSLVSLSGLCSRPVNAQYSSSVFTHMWPDDIVATLRQIGSVMAPGGLCINTWLMIDNHTAFTLRCGLADRALPHKVGEAYTYDQSNPLMCAAYDSAVVERIYADAGHEIIDVLPGSWSGGRDNSVHYQDIVVSRHR
jgi:SAM-dependent methyltransferase